MFSTIKTSPLPADQEFCVDAAQDKVGTPEIGVSKSAIDPICWMTRIHRELATRDARSAREDCGETLMSNKRHAVQTSARFDCSTSYKQI
jgi:hypothetical protein